eukprot:4337540-Amphidinium_carterae.3
MECDSISQVMSPSLEGNQVGRSLAPRTRRAVHLGREVKDERVTEGEIETFSADLVSSFIVLQEQLDSLNKDNRQQVDVTSLAIAQRAKLRMSTSGSKEMNLCQRVDVLTLELETAQFENQTVTQQATHERMRAEARQMCAYMSEERPRVFEQTRARYQSHIVELRNEVEKHKSYFRERVREAMAREIKNKTQQIADLQGTTPSWQRRRSTTTA